MADNGVENSKIFDVSGVNKTNETGTSITEGATQTKINMQSDFTSIGNSINGLKDALKSVQNVSNLYSIDGALQTIQKLSQQINDLSNSNNVTLDGSSEIQHLTNIIQQIQQEEANVKNDLETAINVAIDNSDTQRANEYEQVLSKAEDAVREVTGALTQSVNKMRDAGEKSQEIIIQQAEQLKQSGHVVSTAINEVEQATSKATESTQGLAEQTKNQVADVNALIQDLEKSTGTTRQLIDSISDLSKTFVEQGENGIAQGLEELKTQLEDTQANPTLDSVSTSVSNITTSVNNTLANLSDLQATENGSNTEMLIGRQRLLEKVRDSFNDKLEQTIALLQLKNNNHIFDKNIENMQKTLSELNSKLSTSLDNNHNEFLKAIDNAKTNFLNIQKNAITSGTTEYNSISQQMAKDSLAGIKFNDLASGANDALISLEYSQGKNTPWYQYVTTGNLLGNKTTLAHNFKNTQREAVAADGSYQSLVNAVMNGTVDKDNDNAKKAELIGNLAGDTLSMSGSVRNTAQGMHLLAGGGKNLTAEDKKVFETFQKQIDNSLENLTRTINAIEDLDPKNKTLKQLREEQKALIDLKNKADKAKESSSALSNIFSDIAKGLGKLKSLLAGGLSFLGLGALLSPMQMIRGAIGQEEAEGKRRYQVAINDFSMGANLNGGRIADIARYRANEYFKMTNGMVKEDDYLNHYKTLTQTVGGHYNSDPNSNMQDIAQMTENTFAWGLTNGVDGSTIGAFYKNTYKDLGMSASEATQALVNVGQAAQAAGIPVKQYVSTVNQLSSNLINHGVSARQVMATMARLTVGRGMRIEDASGLIQSTANANENMAKDMNNSAFYGMMAGQGGNPFELILQGFKPYNKDGRPNEDYYSMMADRVFAQADLMGGIGGNGALGGVMYIQNLMSQGYSRAQASQLEDARAHGDKGLFRDLIKKFDEEKDGGKTAYTEAIGKAKEQLKAAGDQVSIFQKLETDLVEAQKKLGWAINKYLSGPLSEFRKGFANVLDRLTKTVGELMKAIADFVGKHDIPGAISNVANFAEENSALTATAAIGAPLALIGGGAVAKNFLTKSMANSNSKVAQNILKYGSKVPGAGKIVAGGLALAAGAAVLGSGALSALVGMFKTGDAKAQATNQGSEANDGIAEQAIQNLNSSLEYNANSDVANSEGTTPSSSYSSEYASEHAGDENSYYYGTGWSEDYSQIDSALIDKKGDYNESLSNAEFLNQSIKERYGDEIENYKIANPNDVYVNANTGEAAEDWEQREKNLDKTTLINNAGLIAGGTIAVPGAAALAVAKKYNLINKDRWDALNNVAKKGKWWSRFAKLGKFGGPLGAGITLADEIINEFSDENSDNYSMGQHVARVAFRGGGAIAGGLAGAKLGALAGSLVGPAGTIVGGFLGGTAGALIGGFAGEGLQNSSVGDALGISDKSAIKTAHDSYAAKVKQSASLYGDATKSIVSSNDNRQKAAARALSEHGIKLEDLTNDQEQYINNVYNDLKSRGLADEVAAFVAGLAAGTVADKQKNDAEYAFNNDEISKGKGMKKTAEVAANEWMTDEQKEQGFESLDPNELSGHDTTWSLKLGGMYLEDGGKDNNLSIEEKKQRLSLLGQIMGGTNAGSGEDKIANAIMNDSDWTDIAGHLVSGPFRNGDRATIANIFQDSNLENFSDEDINKAYNMAYNEVAYVSSTQNEDAIKKNMESVVSTTPNPKDVGDKMQLNKPNPPDNPNKDKDKEQPKKNEKQGGTLESNMDNAMKNIENMQGQIGELAGLKNRDLLRDKIATGQLLLDGATALSSNGKMLSLRGARDLFRAYSGVRDNDLYGSSLQGAYGPKGEILEGAGVFDIGRKMDEKQHVAFKKYTASSEYRRDTSGLDSAMEALKQSYDKVHEQNREIYDTKKEEQAKKEMEKNQQIYKSAEINIINNRKDVYINQAKPIAETSEAQKVAEDNAAKAQAGVS